MKTKKKIFRNIIIILLCFAVVGVAALLIINGHVKSAGKDRILTVEQAAELEDVDCIIVLGCQVKDDGSLSHMLRDRLMRGLEVYEAGVAPKLLMSGDHGREDYDEVGAMKNYAIENGVPSENVFMDHAGFSTYETVYRAKEIFEADKVIIVTQEYHLYSVFANQNAENKNPLKWEPILTVTDFFDSLSEARLGRETGFGAPRGLRWDVFSARHDRSRRR